MGGGCAPNTCTCYLRNVDIKYYQNIIGKTATSYLRQKIFKNSFITKELSNDVSRTYRYKIFNNSFVTKELSTHTQDLFSMEQEVEWIYKSPILTV